MAKKTITTVEFTDDIDGSKAEGTHTVSVNGTHYEIDLNRKNAKAFEKALKPYIDASRKVRQTRERSAAAKPAKRNDLREVRAWAQANGYSVSDRGRIPATVIDAYDARS